MGKNRLVWFIYMSILTNIVEIQEHIKHIQKKQKITAPIDILIATKYANTVQTQAVIDANISLIGENKLQDAELKKQKLTLKNTQYHFIGHLQSNKVNKAVSLFDYIQSVDSFKIAKKINTCCEKQNKVMPCLLQVNLENEPQKYGFTEIELKRQLKDIFLLQNLQIDGIMVIYPLLKNKEDLRPIFKRAKDLFYFIHEQFPIKTLSMGMSHDYDVAIEEGATMVRIGRKILN